MPGAFGARLGEVEREAGAIMKAGLAIEAPSAGTQSRRSRLPGLWHFATEYMVDLPLGAALALIWANANPERYYRVVQAAGFLVNDVAMVAFFGLITKEIVEATAPGGVLTPWRRRRCLSPVRSESPSCRSYYLASWCGSSKNRCWCAAGLRCWPWTWRSATSPSECCSAGTGRFRSFSSWRSAPTASGSLPWPSPSRYARCGSILPCRS